MKRDPLALSAPVRGRALDAARALLEETGVEGLHLRAIAARIGSGVATLYYHFADKEALLAALAVEGWRELAGKIERARTSGKYPHQIDGASAAYLGFIRRNPQLYALMQTQQAVAGREAVRSAEEQAFATFRNSLHGDPRAPAERVEEIALVCWVLGRGIASAVQMRSDEEAGSADRLVETVLSGFAFLLAPRLGPQGSS
jgi:AcrR family transcriptional regulator